MQSLATGLSQTPLRGNHAVALYQLTVSDGEFEVVETQTSTPFDHSHYSEFKYGRRDVATMYGDSLAELLVAHFADRLRADEQIVVIGTPYKRLPNAARMLAITAEHRMRLAGLPTSYTYIYQHRLAEGDYGMLGIADRDKRNKQKKRYIDPDDFAGKHVVVIDDVRITGSIERSIMQLLSDIPVLSTTIVNLVQLDPDIALREPHLEDKLNHYAVRGLRDLLRLMRHTGNFTLTTRAVKYILQSDVTSVQWLLAHLSTTELAELYEGIVDEGYDQMTCYDETVGLVEKLYI